MGGFFASDPPPAPAPVVLPPSPDPEAEAAEERRNAISRNRRGLMGTIATSETGLLQPSGDRAAKTLLGD
ncbi:hypothetical protein H261_08728 [Paramagnetospirillum caucaseum]|uniref:Uncharacterized protein n=1 Tax=Paramagnetospirillum caucaseum TaxID=1244869 RepID=M3AD02_9PROT|nr:hypothetical protein [Paramagnetospirillum caucaseum]EME70394.1 hypothetical protein H261_08728 [Paramagnetospirillum caucaseum]